jgi:putative FmdB family regulatory protein
MPIYEYRCLGCGKRSSLLVLSLSSGTQPACKHCQSTKVERLMSRFAAPKSEDARLESLADPSHFGNVDENDPQSMARFMKKMGKEMGEDFGDEFDEAVEEAEAGDGAGEPAGEMGSTDID